MDLKENKIFRKRFRLSYSVFNVILEKCINSDYFDRWKYNKNALRIAASPMEFLLLGTLQYLGKGWTFDDIEESTGILAETHHVFFKTL